MTQRADWLVSVPVWGATYIDVFERVAAPALRAAVQALPSEDRVRFLFHTDQPLARMADLFPDYSVEARVVGESPTYVALQESHADAVASAEIGERVVLLNADIVVSGNLLTQCAEQFDAGRMAVVLLGIRTVVKDEFPPVGAAPRFLLDWAWAHRHQIIKDLEWPDGLSMLPTNLFWSEGGSVVARGFHLHPVAIVKRKDTSFRSTIDGDLLDCFHRKDIHVVTDPDDCAMLEVSEASRRFPYRYESEGGLTPPRVAASMRTRASAMHRWLFEHRIVVVGVGSDVKGDIPAAREILAELENAPPGEPDVVGRWRGR